MSIRIKKNYLIFNNIKYRCAIGKSGFTTNKREGDGCTPIGTYKINEILYRNDKIKKINTNIKTRKIQLTDGWCDDPKHILYNQMIRFPFDHTAEHLYRNDNLYDILCVLNHNQNPIVPEMGSAIFIHIAKKSYAPTEGCIALKQVELLDIISAINKDTKIVIDH